MAVYSITRFAAPNMDKVKEVTDNMRAVLEGVGANFIDLISYGNGKGVVLAKYPNQSTMDAAEDVATKAFADMMSTGVIEADSVHPHAGVVFNSF